MVNVICAPLGLQIVLYVVIFKNVFYRWIRRFRQFGAGMASESVDIAEKPFREMEKEFIAPNNVPLVNIESR